jgi:hypothetical protein
VTYTARASVPAGFAASLIRCKSARRRSQRYGSSGNAAAEVWYLARMGCARLIIIVMTLGAACCSAATQPVGRIGISIDDARLAAAVRTAIVNDPDLGLRDIVIEAQSGTVILSGQVSSDEEALRASTLAGTIAGVRNVKSTLRVARDS